MTRSVEVVRLPRRRLPAPPSAPLPEPVQAALASIAGDLRHLPRDCIGDPGELLMWLRRMAGRVEGVGRMRVPGDGPIFPKRITQGNASDGSALGVISGPKTAGGFVPPCGSDPTSRDLAEAVFGKGPVAGAPGPRTITSRRGRTVRVEVRRARAAGQMELW